MPVRRYQNLEAAERILWIDSSDPPLAMHIRRVWSFAEHFAPRAASGVTRIRTGEGADATLRDVRRGDAERAGGILDGGHNLDSGTSCGFSSATGSLSNTDPLLDPAGLSDNGGPTQAIALQAGSPAINAGDDTICAAPPVNSVDQRSFVRPGIGATNCSIGAYEFNFPISCGSSSWVFPDACVGAQCATVTPTPRRPPVSWNGGLRYEIDPSGL